ncbi:DNA topoisomerase III [Sporosalibacterium faouarense]|uniref:DNA topoisomerase III n=1 Tax=Sporosalibacterium faouarense TaxID=516123 RepID=UPI001A9C64F4|nr:DNA topoisomerase III [Sporosalibacterium faouarense]
MRTLVLAEKPSVGKDIARVLKCNRNKNGYIEGDRYIVTWALGHLVTLAEPEKYDDKYKSWKLEDLPMLPSPLRLEVIKKTGKQFGTVKSLMHRKDVREIIIATDAGREGELVARWIIDKARVNKPIKRLWISSVTDKAIKEGFNKLRDGKEYNNLYASAVARAETDWYVGMNATRALTCKFNAQLSCGRVQTPTLNMIAQRQDEINNFKPKTYYGITAYAQELKLTWQDNKSKYIRTFNKEKRDKIFKSVKGKTANVIKVDRKHKKTYSPKLYDLTELQRDANRIFDFSAKETLSIMQNLYERHKLLTYPRTDSRYLTTDIVDTLKDRLKACSFGEYKGLTSKVMKKTIRGNKSFVDNSKVSDHHAIIPTEESASLVSLSYKERQIYDLVVKRFLAVLYPPFEYEQTTITAEIGDSQFTAKGKIVKKQGWKEVYDNGYEDEEDSNLKDQILPQISEGDSIKITKLVETQGETKPPAPFNEGTLLSAMENPKRYMGGESKDLIEIIGETGGLGTVATRADIIEKLFNSHFIEQKGKSIYITSKGKQLLDLVPEDLKSPALTAEWEQKLGRIAKGKLSKNSFINEMKNYSKEVVKEIKNSDETFRHDNLTRTKCPDCGKYMLEIKNKKGKMLVCQDRSCGYRKGISRITNRRCPTCHKKLELRGKGDGQIFVCKCGFREKLSVFQENKKNNQKVSKREVNKYLKKQKKQKEEPINTALADALAKLKMD